jgi:hypothetical protein
MLHNRLVLNARIFSVSLVIVAAALAVASVSLLTYTPGFAAKSPIQASASATLDGPLKEVCLVPSSSLAQLNNLTSTGVEGCTVTTAASSPALSAAKPGNAGSGDVNPLSFSVAALESMSWRNAAQNSNANPLSFSTAALESMSLRNATQTSSTNSLSISTAALESMSWRLASQSQVRASR